MQRKECVRRQLLIWVVWRSLAVTAGRGFDLAAPFRLAELFQKASVNTTLLPLLDCYLTSSCSSIAGLLSLYVCWVVWSLKEWPYPQREMLWYFWDRLTNNDCRRSMEQVHPAIGRSGYQKTCWLTRRARACKHYLASQHLLKCGGSLVLVSRLAPSLIDSRSATLTNCCLFVLSCLCKKVRFFWGLK